MNSEGKRAPNLYSAMYFFFLSFFFLIDFFFLYAMLPFFSFSFSFPLILEGNLELDILLT